MSGENRTTCSDQVEDVLGLFFPQHQNAEHLPRAGRNPAFRGYRNGPVKPSLFQAFR